MKTKLYVDPTKMDVNKLQVLIDKLTELGVYNNGEIICEPKMDKQVLTIMNEILLTELSQVNIYQLACL